MNAVCVGSSINLEIPNRESSKYKTFTLSLYYREKYLDSLMTTIPLRPSGHYMYRQFNIHKLYVLPTQLYLCVFCESQNKQRLFSYTILTD